MAKMKKVVKEREWEREIEIEANENEKVWECYNSQSGAEWFF